MDEYIIIIQKKDVAKKLVRTTGRIVFNVEKLYSMIFPCNNFCFENLAVLGTLY